MSLYKSNRFQPYPLQVLRHLQRCEVCLSRVTGAVGTIQMGEADRLVANVRACMLAELVRRD